MKEAACSLLACPSPGHLPTPAPLFTLRHAAWRISACLNATHLPGLSSLLSTSNAAARGDFNLADGEQRRHAYLHRMPRGGWVRTLTARRRRRAGGSTTGRVGGLDDGGAGDCTGVSTLRQRVYCGFTDAAGASCRTLRALPATTAPHRTGRDCFITEHGSRRMLGEKRTEGFGFAILFGAVSSWRGGGLNLCFCTACALCLSWAARCLPGSRRGISAACRTAILSMKLSTYQRRRALARGFFLALAVGAPTTLRHGRGGYLRRTKGRVISSVRADRKNQRSVRAVPVWRTFGGARTAAVI